MALGGMFGRFTGDARGRSNLGAGATAIDHEQIQRMLTEQEQIERMLDEQQINVRRYNIPTDPMADNARRKQMIWSRWHLHDGETIPFPFLETHLAGDKVLVFVARKDHQYAVFEDEAAMYPSDALMTQLRAVS